MIFGSVNPINNHAFLVHIIHKLVDAGFDVFKLMSSTFGFSYRRKSKKEDENDKNNNIMIF